MKLKRHINFVNSLCDIESVNESVSIYNGDFIVTKNMVSNGMLIKDLIPREVTGYFECDNMSLTSLIGSPDKVGDYFSCSDNKLLSLKGSSRLVKGNFYCSGNLLTSLEGIPGDVGGSYWCRNNPLSSLEYGPKGFIGNIYVDKDLDLEIEKVFIESGKYKDNYWLDLLKYMIDTNIDLTEVSGWPKGFLTDNMIRSAKGISKFKL